MSALHTRRSRTDARSPAWLAIQSGETLSSGKPSTGKPCTSSASRRAMPSCRRNASGSATVRRRRPALLANRTWQRVRRRRRRSRAANMPARKSLQSLSPSEPLGSGGRTRFGVDILRSTASRTKSRGFSGCAAINACSKVCRSWSVSCGIPPICALADLDSELTTVSMQVSSSRRRLYKNRHRDLNGSSSSRLNLHPLVMRATPDIKGAISCASRYRW
mmetsp:Transcript_127494/g.220985  ORF Transcript_127494/g.220985 Transcript_127494/m.220985 type:complete len:219 (+) Transcript_127494:1993-2649(+)